MRALLFVLSFAACGDETSSRRLVVDAPSARACSLVLTDLDPSELEVSSELEHALVVEPPRVGLAVVRRGDGVVTEIGDVGLAVVERVRCVDAAGEVVASEAAIR